jgi:23S rRNA pseudouridine2605 synthase
MSTTPTSREPQRIAKLLARAGIASRREIERMIAEGRIAKDGVVLDTPATILTSLQGVTVDGNPVKAPEPTRLFLYHKPSGLLTTERDPKGRPTIYDKLPRELPRVMPVGRLDLNTEGLLLLTTDGEFKRQLELPATGITRSYRARAYGNITQAQLEDLIDGIEIEGVRYGSIDANIERRTGANVWIELKLAEGKNREVRRVLEHFGLKVSRLIRTAYGPFVLGDVPSGGVDEVRQNDVFAFRKNMNLQAFSGGDDRTAHPQRPAPSRPSSPKPAPKPSRSRAEAPKPRPAPSRPSPPRSRPESADARPARSKPGSEAAKAGPASPRPGKPPQKPGARRGASFNPRATGGRPPAAPSGGGGRGRRK